MNPALRMRAMFALLMSLLMSSLMSGWVTWLNLGLGAGFMSHWKTAFMAAWPAAFTIVMLCGPMVHRLAARIAS